ncbi:hypothetical protein NO1_0363 [Candidatus Termititenax aidoneus]|uniref:Uncharacterized protein n=1 Tax=Termititenax aidoneus TaxID=2218524 RepID=A0A388T8F2_TERA1|nr:hypothetical protein NO1_0363 [Candidatus Termititenax aidoneus]
MLLKNINFEDKPKTGGGVPPKDPALPAVAKAAIGAAGGAIMNSCGNPFDPIVVDLGSTTTEIPSDKPEENTLEWWKDQYPGYHVDYTTGEPLFPQMSGPSIPPDVKSHVVVWGNAGNIIFDDYTTEILIRDSRYHPTDKNQLAAMKVNLAYFYEQYQKTHGVTPTEITFTITDIKGQTPLQEFRFYLLDSVSSKEAELAQTDEYKNDPEGLKALMQAHTISVKLGDTAELARAGFTFNEAEGSITIDLTKRSLYPDTVMLDEGEGDDPADASYIDGYSIGSAGEITFKLRARPDGKKSWGFVGVYTAAGFDLTADSVFSYTLGDFQPPIYPNYSVQDKGYRVVFSYGSEKNGNYRELIYDPNEFSDSSPSAVNVPAERAHEKYLALRDAEALALGNNNLRLKFYGKDSRVTINDTVERPEDKFKFDVDHDDMSDSTRISYLKFKVRKTTGLSGKADFFSKVRVGLKLEDVADANQDASCPVALNGGRMNYILEEDLDVNYYEISVPLLFVEGIGFDRQNVLSGVYFESLEALEGLEIKDIQITAVEQGDRSLPLVQVDRTGFSGFGAALDNKDAQEAVILRDLKIGGREILQKIDLDSRVEEISILALTGTYENDDMFNGEFTSTGQVIYTLKASEPIVNSKAIFGIPEDEEQTDQ